MSALGFYQKRGTCFTIAGVGSTDSDEADCQRYARDPFFLEIAHKRFGVPNGRLPNFLTVKNKRKAYGQSFGEAQLTAAVRAIGRAHV